MKVKELVKAIKNDMLECVELEKEEILEYFVQTTDVRFLINKDKEYTNVIFKLNSRQITNKFSYMGDISIWVNTWRGVIENNIEKEVCVVKLPDEVKDFIDIWWQDYYEENIKEYSNEEIEQEE